MKFYSFHETRYWAGSRPVVGFVEASVVENTFSAADMGALFGGSLEYEDDAGVRYRGVWGDRKVGKFRRLLGDRGVTLEMQPAQPDGFRQLWRRTTNDSAS